ncbi:shikimate kinase [Glaciecola sp. SC05]|uniref:shikimate kinase n=1 Tax=Glaciecola sp. SC05 TaxID=1987355 RepID=UPI0035276AE5
MRKVIIFGNSGSGKSTLAKKLKAEGLAHLDLDTIAWQPSMPPERKALDESQKALAEFDASNDSWVIEGCYTDLLEMAANLASEAIFMNLEVDLCIQNAKSRPWERHKYPSKQAQDQNLSMLIEWIAQYPKRTDTFSKSAHEALFSNFNGVKVMLTENL